MKPFLRTYLLIVMAGSACLSASAQADPTKYKERAAAVREEVWGWKLPAFTNRTVPAEYANESCVIMARRAVIEADTKKKLTWALGMKRDFYYNSTVREMVKINDKVSLEEYSQLSYRQFKKLNSWISATSTTFVGARIIKPNGAIKEVNVDESVLLQGGDNDQKRKLAVSDLQVGDMLDFYIRVEEFSEYIKEPERLIYFFGDDHPILDYSIHCDVGKKYAVEYRSMNHAPEAKQTTNEDKDIILDIALSNLPAVPSGFWMSSLRETPAFRLNVLAGGTLGAGRSQGEVVKNVPLKDIINRINSGMSYPDPLTRQTLEKQVMEVLRGYDKQYRKLPKDSLANLIYYAYRFVRYYNQVDKSLEVGEDRNSMDINSYDYLIYLQPILSLHKIQSRFVVMPYKHGPDIQQVMGVGDLSVMLEVELDKTMYFTNLDMFTYPGYIPASLEGQPCPEVRARGRGALDDIGLNEKTPLSTAAENMHREDLQVAFNGTDMQLLRVKRHTVLAGKMKEDEQLRLCNFEDCYESERNALRVEKSIMDELKKARRSKNVSEDYATALQKARNSLKDRFQREVSSEFEQDPKEMISWKLDNPGLRHNAPDMIYSTEFTVDGLVQRAGNNFLLNIGKVVNSPIKLSASQRIRKVDIYMPYARTLDCTFAFAIPAGYTVQGADKLNKTLENECGTVISTAQVQGNQMILHFKRTYKHTQEPTEKWPQLLAILDASTDLAGQKVLLKKG